MTDWKRKNLWQEQETGQVYTPKKTKKKKDTARRKKN